MNIQRLTKKGNHYFIDEKTKVVFGTRTHSFCTKTDLHNTMEFSHGMTFGASGEHRDHRSGGMIHRDLYQQFYDIFIGKLGEIAFYNAHKNHPAVMSISDIDYDRYGLGIWDNTDFILNQQYHIAVKTTKHFGNLLLLEAKDWKIKGEDALYIPNIKNNVPSSGRYDRLYFCRVKVNIEKLIPPNSINAPSNINHFKVMIPRIQTNLEIVGYILNKQLKFIMENDFLLPQGALLNGRTVMDADNYYLQSVFFKEIQTATII